MKALLIRSAGLLALVMMLSSSTCLNVIRLFGPVLIDENDSKEQQNENIARFICASGIGTFLCPEDRVGVLQFSATPTPMYRCTCSDSTQASIHGSSPISLRTQTSIQSPDYFPLSEGNYWEYSVIQSPDNFRLENGPSMIVEGQFYNTIGSRIMDSNGVSQIFYFPIYDDTLDQDQIFILYQSGPEPAPRPGSWR